MGVIALVFVKEHKQANENTDLSNKTENFFSGMHRAFSQRPNKEKC